jgi:hypothetical protein
MLYQVLGVFESDHASGMGTVIKLLSTVAHLMSSFVFRSGKDLYIGRVRTLVKCASAKNVPCRNPDIYMDELASPSLLC